MAAPTRTPRTSWIEEGLRALAAGGPDAVRVEPLAKSLDVTKGGFYWQFDDRRAAPQACRQPANGIHALAVRCLLPRRGRGRGRGPLHGHVLAVDRQPLH